MTDISRRQFIRTTALAGAGALLTACGGPLPSAPPQRIPTVVDEQGRPWPRPDVARERTLIFITVEREFGYAGIGNPYVRTHQHGAAAMMEGLFYYAALTDKTYAWLAEAYAYNDDATEITVTLREGAAWADGEPFDAHDVVFTLELLQANAPLLNYSSKVARTVAEAVAVDDRTVRITFTEPNWRFHFDFLTYRFDRGIFWVPEHIWSDPEILEDPRTFPFYDPTRFWPLHTGPYAQTTMDPLELTYDLRYDWWAVTTGLAERLPYPERIIVLPSSGEESASVAIMVDDADITTDLRPATIASLLERAADHVVTYTGNAPPYGYVDWWTISLFFNTLEPPYDDARVRWAVAYAIDQQAIVDLAWEGAGRPTAHPFPEYPRLMDYIAGAADVLAAYDVLAQDLDRVAALMTEAGYTRNADGFWAGADGRPLNAEVYAPVPPFGGLAAVVVEQLRAAGFDAEHITAPDVWADLSTGEALLHFFGHSGSVYDPWTTLDMYHGRWVVPTGDVVGPNRPRWSNAEYDARVEAMAALPVDDRAALQALFNDAMAIWYRELPEVPLVQWFHRIAMNTTYWRGWPGPDDPYTTGPWHLTFPLTLWRLEPA